MRLINSDEIEKSIDIIEKLSDVELQNIIDDLSQKQPEVFSYLMSISDLFDEEVSEYIFFIGFTVIFVMKGENTMSFDEIEKLENDNLLLFEAIDGQNEDGMDEVLSLIIEDYDQKYLLKYVAEEVRVEEEEGGLYFDIEEIGIVIAYLKTIIDCIDK